MTHTDPTSITYLAGVTVKEDREESGSGCYDILDHGTYLGYMYSYRGQWWAVSIRRTVGDGGALDFLRPVDAVNHLVLDYRVS